MPIWSGVSPQDAVADGAEMGNRVISNPSSGITGGVTDVLDDGAVGQVRGIVGAEPSDVDVHGQACAAIARDDAIADFGAAEVGVGEDSRSAAGLIIGDKAIIDPRSAAPDIDAASVKDGGVASDDTVADGGTAIGRTAGQGQ